MSAWHFVSSICTARTCYLTYRSADRLLGRGVFSTPRKADTIRYYVWDWPDTSGDYATEAEARAALESQQATDVP